MLLRQPSYAIKNQLKAPKAPYLGLWDEMPPTRGFSCLSFVASLRHEDRWLICTEIINYRAGATLCHKAWLYLFPEIHRDHPESADGVYLVGSAAWLSLSHRVPPGELIQQFVEWSYVLVRDWYKHMQRKNLWWVTPAPIIDPFRVWKTSILMP